MRRTLIGAASLLTAVLAGGCTESTGPDQCLRREIFQQLHEGATRWPAGDEVQRRDEV